MSCTDLNTAPQRPTGGPMHNTGIMPQCMKRRMTQGHQGQIHIVFLP